MGSKPNAECRVCQTPIRKNKTGLCQTHHHQDPDTRQARAARMRARWDTEDAKSFRNGGKHPWVQDIPTELKADYTHLTKSKGFNAVEARELLGLPPRENKNAPRKKDT